MIEKTWKVVVEDTPDSPPFSVVDDLVVVVRTPRSSDFVTVEVGSTMTATLSPPSSGPCRAACCSRPAPWVSDAWCGEVHVGEGESVGFEAGSGAYQLTLESIHTQREWPWASYEFRLKRREAAGVVEGHGG